MAVDDLYRCAFAYGVDGQTNINVLYFKQEQPAGGNEDAQRAAEILGTRLAAIYLGILPQGVRTARNCVVHKVARLTVDQGEFDYQFPAGGATGDALPSVVATVIRLRTGLAGRTRRGRVYLGGVPFGWETGGSINATGQTGYQAWVTAMTSEFVGTDSASSYRLGVFSRTRYAINTNPFDEYWAPVTSMAIVDAVTSQRRRRIGVGS